MSIIRVPDRTLPQSTVSLKTPVRRILLCSIGSEGRNFSSSIEASHMVMFEPAAFSGCQRAATSLQRLDRISTASRCRAHDNQIHRWYCVMEYVEAWRKNGSSHRPFAGALVSHAAHGSGWRPAGTPLTGRTIYDSGRNHNV